MCVENKFDLTRTYPCEHMSRKRCPAVLRMRHFRSIRRSVTRPVLQSLVSALVLTADTSRLRLCYARRSTRHFDGPSAVFVERCGSPRVFSEEVRPRHVASEGPSLAARAGTHFIPTRRAGLWLHARSRAIIHCQ